MRPSLSTSSVLPTAPVWLDSVKGKSPCACADDELDKIYDSGCALSQDLSVNSTTGHCDSQYFVCRPLTTEIYAYDDPVTGLAYNCEDNPKGAETCEEDEVNLCCNLDYPPDSDDPIYN
ncbi:hypothetical protein FJTKL_01980 [Diaporthe vaccinii]|uniref:Uncharacterized protein n=1 Tax=Diaporthe vaccinii TaxID=105482 RepID=A0ABR4DZJ8_9PEZI